MALTYVGSNSSYASGSTSTGATVDLTALSGGSNTSPSTGDIVIVAVATGSSTDRSIGVTTSGYSEIVELYSGDDNASNFSVNWKIMGASPDTSVVTTPSGNNNDALTVIAHVWRGVDSGTPFDVSYQSATGTNGGRPTPPAITPTTSGAIIIACGCAGVANAQSAGFTTATLSNFITINITDSYDSVSGMGSYAWTSGTYTPAQFGGNRANTGDSWCAATLALRPLAVAPTVTTQAVSSIASTTATGNGNVTADGGATVSERGVCWKTSTGPTTADSKANSGTGTGAYTVSMTSLSPNTLYYVKAYAINSVGTSYGSEVTFTTLSSGPANLKTYNTNPVANIKSINTNLIANVKTLNTNA